MTTRPIRALIRTSCLVVGLWLVVSQTAIVGQEPLPSGREVIARHIKAIGGEDAFKGIKSIRVRGRFEMAAQGIGGDFELLSARPDKMLMRVEIASVGHVETGYDGKTGWSIDPLSGPALLSGRQLTEIADDAWFDSALHASDHVQEVVTVDREDFAQRPAYKVRVVFKSGQEQFEYFDVEAGWQIGTEGTRETPMGVVPTVSTLRDYKKFGALMQPTTLVQRAMGIEQTLHVTSCEYGVVNADAFDMPAPIKALIK
jgi:hypothetical protein